MKRRALLSSLGVAAVAGCVGADSGNRTESTETSPPASTRTEVPTRTPAPTNSCAEQPIQSDLTVENRLDEPRRVTVTVRSEDGSQTLSERTVETSAGDRVAVDEKLFTAATPDTHDYVAEAVSGDLRDAATVTIVVRHPTTYGILVWVDADGLTVRDHHGDPGPAYNPNCY